MAELVVTRLMQNPLGQIAPAGQRGDIVRVSDGASAVYLLPAEFDALDDDMVRTALASAARQHATERGPIATPMPSRAAQPPATRPPPVPRKPASVTTAGGPDDKAGSLTSPRRAGRPAQSLW